MKNFFKKNKVLSAVIVCALIIAGVCYLARRVSPESPDIEGSQIVGQMLVTKVLDGDTIIVEGGYSVRLLGIDADERGWPCYGAAKERLEELVLNKEVRLERDKADIDQYGRYLRYIFLTTLDSESLAGRDKKNINLQIVEEGLAIARFYPENVKYKEEIIQAEKKARLAKIGCKWQEESETEKEEPKEELAWERLTITSTGLPVIKASEAKDWIDREVIVEGKIIDTYKYKETSIFLNFCKAYPEQCFTGLIWSSDWPKFPEGPQEYYREKTVRIRGKIIEYKGALEIILKDPDQIEIGK